MKKIKMIKPSLGITATLVSKYSVASDAISAPITESAIRKTIHSIKKIII